MERQRHQKGKFRFVVLMGAGILWGMFPHFPIAYADDGTCAAVRDSEGNLHPCDWTRPQQNNNNYNNNQENQRQQEQEREQRARERQKGREQRLQVQQRERQVQERERAVLLKQQALTRQRKEREALKQLQVAHHHGEIARQSKKKAHSAAQSQIGFDKPGGAGEGSGIIEIDHMGWKMKVPRKIARDHGFRKLDHQMTALITKHRALRTKLRKVEHRLRQATDTKQKETLQMEVVHLKQANAKIESQAAMVHKKEKDFVHYHMGLIAGGSP